MKAALLEWVDQFPPFLCRLLARQGRGRGTRGMTHHEIVVASGLSKSTVSELSCKTTWADVTIDVAARFIAACGLDVFALGRQRDFLDRQAPLEEIGYIKNCQNAEQRKMYSKLLELYEHWSKPKPTSPAVAAILASLKRGAQASDHRAHH